MPFLCEDSTEEELFKAIGDYGPWQRAVFGIIFYAYTVGMWQNFGMTFLTPNVPFRCIQPYVNYSEESWPGQCSVQLDHNATNRTEMVPCSRWEYDTSVYSETLVSEWDLVCDREWLISLSKSVFMIGFMTSVFISGQLADWVGRRQTYIIGCVVYITTLILSLFSPSMEVFLFFRFMQAFSRAGTTITGFAILMEIVGPRHRTFVGTAVQLGWSTSYLILALIGYFCKHWFWFQVVTYLPALPLLFTFSLIPESPRWLITRKKLVPLKNLIKVAAKKNGRNLNLDEALQNLTTVKLQKKGTLLDLFRTPGIRTNMLNMMYLWVVNSFLYYALSYNTNDLSGDPYINFLLIGLIEFPAYGLLYFASTRLGRRPTLVALMMLAGASCVAPVPVPDDMVWLSTSFCLCGKFCVTASFGLLYFYTGEIFPTVVRTAALGSCSGIARVGSIVAPFTRELSKASHSSVPNILNCVLAVSSGFGALWLPETRDRKLPDSLEEGALQARKETTSNKERDICLRNIPVS